MSCKNCNLYAIMIKVLFAILIGCCMMSCAPGIVSLSTLKTEYDFIDFEKFTYFAHKSDIARLSKGSINCVAQSEEDLKIWIGDGPDVRRVTKWGLKMEDVYGLDRDGFFLAYTMVFDSAGKAVLSTIVNTDLDISEDGKLYLLHRILEAEATPGPQEFSCLCMRISFKSKKESAEITPFDKI